MLVKILSRTKDPLTGERDFGERRQDAGVASRRILVDFWRTMEVVNAHRESRFHYRHNRTSLH